jgi:hypothetical protein
VRVGEIPKCGCGRTKNPPYCDGSHYEPREVVEAAQAAGSTKRLMPVVKRLESSQSDEIKKWNAAVELRRAEKRQRTTNGPV